MNLFKILLLSVSLVPLLIGCNETPEYTGKKAVIDGWIDSDGFPVVIFTTSLNPEESDNNLSDIVIRWGKVTITDGTDTIVMTGGPTGDVFPPYRYTTQKLRGTPGKTYTITADYRTLHAFSECYMPYPTPIKEIKTLPVEGNDSIRAAEVIFESPADCPAYYYITLRDTDSISRSLPALLGTYKATIPFTEVTLPLLNFKSITQEDHYIPQFKIGRKIEVNLCRVTEEVYEFWTQYENGVLFGGTQFFDSSNSLHGNINGGYGIWCAQGVSSLSFEIK